MKKCLLSLALLSSTVFNTKTNEENKNYLSELNFNRETGVDLTINDLQVSNNLKLNNSFYLLNDGIQKFHINKDGSVHIGNFNDGYPIFLNGINGDILSKGHLNVNKGLTVHGNTQINNLNTDANSTTIGNLTLGGAISLLTKNQMI